jgi:hypothetical protein
LEALFSVSSALRLYDSTDRVEYSGVKWAGWWAVRGLLRYSRCELLLLETSSWGTEIIQEPRVRRTSAVESRYQTTTGEDTADWEDLVRAVVNCRVCESAIALQLLVVTIYKWSTNPITNPNPVYSHSYTWQYIYMYTWQHTKKKLL